MADKFPNLREKVLFLFSLGKNQELREFKDIVKHLPGTKSAALTPNNLSMWFSQNNIPKHHVLPFCELFSIRPDVLEMPYDSFKQAVQGVPGLSWQTFASRASHSDAISLRKSVVPRALGTSAWKKKYLNIPHFTIEDRVRLELDISLKYGLREFLCGLFIVDDSRMVTCLCPNQAIPPQKYLTTDDFFQVPALSAPALEFFAARGLHTVFALLTRTTLPAEIYDLLQSPLRGLRRLAVLDRIATEVSLTPEQDLRFLKMEFEVV